MPKCLKEYPGMGDHPSREQAKGQEAQETQCRVRSFGNQERVFRHYKSTPDNARQAARVKGCVPVCRPPGSQEPRSHALRVKVSTAVLAPSPHAFPAVPGSPQLLISRAKSPLHTSPRSTHLTLYIPGFCIPLPNSASPGGPARYGQQVRTLHPAKHLTSNNPGTKFTHTATGPIARYGSMYFPNLSPPVCLPLWPRFITPGHICLGTSLKSTRRQLQTTVIRKSSHILQDLRL